MKLQAAARLVEARPHRDDEDLIEVTFSLKRNSDAARNVPNILAVLQFMGDVGCSRSITIDDMAEGGGPLKFGFDGDGSDVIRDLKVDGKDYEFDSSTQELMK